MVDFFAKHLPIFLHICAYGGERVNYEMKSRNTLASYAN